MKKLWMRITLFVLGLLLLFIFPSCPGNSAGQSPTGDQVILGTLGEGFAADLSVVEARSISGQISGIASFRVMASALTLQETVPVEEDGSFEVPVEADDSADALLLFIDDTAESVEDRFARSGFIALETEEGEGMARLPVSGSELDTINLGTIDYDDESGQGLSSLDQLSQARIFNLDFGELQSYHRYDMALREARNIFVNDDPESGQFCSAGTGMTDTLNLATTRNAWSPVSAEPHRMVSVVFSVSNPKGHTYNDINSGAVTIEIVPPEDIVMNASWNVYGPDNPLSSGNTAELGGALTIGDNPALPGSYGIGLDIDGESGVPGGVWRLREDGEVFAIFDFSSLAPFDDEGNFLYFLPSFRVTVDESGKVNQLDLKWYSWDEAEGDYTELADQSIVHNWFLNYGLLASGYQDSGGGPSLVEQGTENGNSITEFSEDWYFDEAPSGDVLLASVGVLCNLGNMSFSFHYGHEEL